MIKPVVFVKVLSTTALNGDRATKLSKAWRVSVTNGEESFYPGYAQGFSCFQESPDIFNFVNAITLAKSVAKILDCPIMLYKRSELVEIFEGDYVDPPPPPPTDMELYALAARLDPVAYEAGNGMSEEEFKPHLMAILNKHGVKI
jgi:hypothetical protein